MSGCKSDEEREFYIRLAIKERYTKRQLERQIYDVCPSDADRPFKKTE